MRRVANFRLKCRHQQTCSTPSLPSGSMENKRNPMPTLTLKHFRSIIFIGLVCLGATLVLSSCSKKPQDQIIGKWTVAGQTNVMEFRADGTVNTMENGKETLVKYKFLDNTNLQMELNVPAGTNKVVVQFTFGVAIHGDTADLSIELPARGGAPAATQTMHLNRAK
jgi:hypothetical protein